LLHRLLIQKSNFTFYFRAVLSSELRTVVSQEVELPVPATRCETWATREHPVRVIERQAASCQYHTSGWKWWKWRYILKWLVG